MYIPTGHSVPRTEDLQEEMMDGLSVQEVLSWTWTCIGKNWIEGKEEK